MGDYSTANIPFPPVELTPEEVEALRATSEAFVQDHIRQYAQLRFQQHGQLDPKRWKVVSQQENVTVYKERRKFRQSSMVTPELKTNKNRLQEYDASQTTMPVMISVGTIPGTMEDVMFGLIMTTTTSMKVKTKYWQDHQIDGGVLATMVKPTEDDPFHTANIKWMVKGVPAYVRSIVHARDLVYSEYTGIVNCDNGERIGYRMEHSLDIPGVRDLYKERGIVRMKYSICSLFRELPDGSGVEFFLKGVMDPLGNVMEKIAVDTAAEALVAYWRSTYTAQLKKLAYFVRHAKPLDSKPHRTKSSKCGGCLKSFHLLARVKRCRLCGANVCSKCNVQRSLCFVLPNERVVTRKLSFCLACLGRVNCTDTRSIAIEELVHGDEYLLSSSTPLESSRSHSSSESSHPSHISAVFGMTAPIPLATPHHHHQPRGGNSSLSGSSMLLPSADRPESASTMSKASEDTVKSTSVLDDASQFHIPAATANANGTAGLVTPTPVENTQEQSPMFALAPSPRAAASVRDSEELSIDIDDSDEELEPPQDEDLMMQTSLSQWHLATLVGQKRQVSAPLKPPSDSQRESGRSTVTSSLRSSLSVDNSPPTASTRITPPSTQSQLHPPPRRRDAVCDAQPNLYEQMVGLCQVAEQVQQLTMHTTTLMSQRFDKRQVHF